MIDWQRTTVEPATPLIALSAIKRHCRIFNDDDDDYLRDLLIPSAIATVQRDTRWQINPIELTAKLPAGTRVVKLPGGPYVSAVLKHVAIDESETTVEGVTHDGGMPGRLSLPAIATPHVGLVLSIIIGSQPPDPAIVIMICTLVAHWFEHREAVTADGEAKEVPLGYRHLCKALDPMTDGFTVAGAVNASTP